MTTDPAGLLVHGMSGELAEPDWRPLTDGEVNALLACYSEPGDADGGGPAHITWRSPRPMSAAALVRWAGHGLFVKRHHRRVRTPGQLAAEHAFATHLRSHGLDVPTVRRARDGTTAVASGEWVYEVHEVAEGVDLYRDAMSWTPFASLGHARAAGARLARLHVAAASFRWPARPWGVLMNSCDVTIAEDPLAAVGHLARRGPGLARYLDTRPWEDDLARHHLPVIARAAPSLAGLPRQWGHGDWHPSNLTWTSKRADAGVVAVFDFGLANQTFTVHDLALALERSTVAWLDLAGTGRADADVEAADALLDGYQGVRPLLAAEAAAIPELLPVVHLEYALSEIAYFAGVVRSPGNADLAYDYLVGHAAWFSGPEGSALLDHLRRRARPRRPNRARAPRPPRPHGQPGLA